MKNSPLKQDVKFDTTLHNYGKRAHLMTDKERSNYREGMGIALSFSPIPAAKGISILGRIVSKIISKAPQIKKAASAFANTAKQYLKPSKKDFFSIPGPVTTTVVSTKTKQLKEKYENK